MKPEHQAVVDAFNSQRHMDKPRSTKPTVYRSSVTQQVHKIVFGEDLRGNLPKAGLSPVDVMLDDMTIWTVWIDPFTVNPTQYKRSTHRFKARCKCGAVVSVGRIHQHRCKEAK